MHAGWPGDAVAYMGHAPAYIFHGPFTHAPPGTRPASWCSAPWRRGTRALSCTAGCAPWPAGRQRHTPISCTHPPIARMPVSGPHVGSMRKQADLCACGQLLQVGAAMRGLTETCPSHHRSGSRQVSKQRPLASSLLAARLDDQAGRRCSCGGACMCMCMCVAGRRPHLSDMPHGVRPAVVRPPAFLVLHPQPPEVLMQWVGHHRLNHHSPVSREPGASIHACMHARPGAAHSRGRHAARNAAPGWPSTARVQG